MALRSKPVVLPWLLAAALTALLAGSLFRAYSQTHVALFRMFGTISVVLVGFFATRTFYALQERDALDRLAEVLEGLPTGFAVGPAVQVPDPDGRRPLVVDLVIVGQRSVILVGIDVTRPVATASAARRRLQRLAWRLWRVRRILEQRAAVPLSALILALYRDPGAGPGAERGAGPVFIEGVPVVTPEQLATALTRVDAEAAAEPLPPDIRARLLEGL